MERSYKAKTLIKSLVAECITWSLITKVQQTDILLDSTIFDTKEMFSAKPMFGWIILFENERRTMKSNLVYVTSHANKDNQETNKRFRIEKEAVTWNQIETFVHCPAYQLKYTYNDYI